MCVKLANLALAIGLVQAGCESSLLGPDIDGRDYGDDAGLSESGVVVPRNVAITPNESSGGSNQTNTEVIIVNCDYSPQRKVFYGKSAVNQTFLCDRSVTAGSLLASGQPAYLTASILGQSISFTGTAPQTASSSNWSFTVNDGNTTGDAASVDTTILSPTTLIPLLTATAVDTTASGSNSNGIEVNLNHSLSLDSNWDGVIADVTLTATGVSSDIPNLQFFSACGQSGSYVCIGGSPSRTGLTVDSDLRLRWQWSAFDQGTYYIEVNADATIESGQNTLAAASTQLTVPLQASGGNVALVSSNILTFAGANDPALRYAMAFSSASLPQKPVVGVLYIGRSGGSRAYVRRAEVDRTVSPAAQAVTVSSAMRLDTRNSQDFTLQALSATRWVAVGGVAGTATFDLGFDIFDSDWTGTDPPPDLSVTLTNYSNTGNRALWLDSSEPFSEGAKTYIGIAYVRQYTDNNSVTTSHLTVLKANVDGTTVSTILDDSRYDLAANATGHAGSNSGIDRLRLQVSNHAGIPYFYLAYREGTAIKLSRLRREYSATLGYERAGPLTVTADALSDDANNATAFDWQSLDLSINTHGGLAQPAIVYRDKNGNCWFQQVTADLSAASTPLALSSRDCRHPSLHYNAAASTYIVTYAEQVDGNTTYDIKSVEVTASATPTLGLAVTIVSGLATFPAKLATRLYPAGNWLALGYRLNSANSLILHGYHVRGR